MLLTKRDISSATYLGPYDKYSVLAVERQNLGNLITHRFAIPSPRALCLPASSLQHSHCTSGRELRMVHVWMPTRSQSSPTLIAEAPVFSVSNTTLNSSSPLSLIFLTLVGIRFTFYFLSIYQIWLQPVNW